MPCRGFLKTPAVMRKVASVAQACQLLTVACENLATASQGVEGIDGPHYIAPAELSSLNDLPIPTASGAIVRFGSRRYTSLCVPFQRVQKSLGCQGLVAECSIWCPHGTETHHGQVIKPVGEHTCRGHA